MRFSRRTVIAAIELMEGEIRGHADLTRCLLKWDSLLNDMCDAGLMKDRYNPLIKFIDGQPAYKVDGDKLLWDEVVETAVALIFKDNSAPWGEPDPPKPTVSALLRALDVDGFTVSEGELRRSLPEIVDLPEAEDEIQSLLKKHGFSLATGHLKQAFANHTAGQWAAANSQIRSFIDSLLDEVCERLDPTAAALGSGQVRRSKLAASGFLIRNLNEWDDNGLGYVNGLVKRLHPHGSHPGLSDQDDSTFRLHTVLLAARLFLRRYDALP